MINEAIEQIGNEYLPREIEAAVATLNFSEVFSSDSVDDLADKIIDRIESAREVDRIAAREAEQRLDEVTRLVVSALPGARVRHFAESSRYVVYRGLEIRVSDHPQPRDGGWNERTGLRHGASDVCIDVSESLDRSGIRRRIAFALWRSQ